MFMLQTMLLMLRMAFGILNIIRAVLCRILLFIRKKPQKIPPITDSLLTFSATALARKIRQREVSLAHTQNIYIFGNIYFKFCQLHAM